MLQPSGHTCRPYGVGDCYDCERTAQPPLSLRLSQPTAEHPVPIVSTATATHGRLVESQTGGADVRTWCGRTLTISDQPFVFPMPGMASAVSAVSCKSCRRSRPAGWAWTR